MVVDADSKQMIANWPTGELKSNFPLALDDSEHIFAVFRHPARIGVFAAQSGELLSSVDTCGDSDAVFVDSKRARLYVVCGEGFVDVYSKDKDQLHEISRIATAAGARTGLFVPETDRLYVAARASIGNPAAIWVLRPNN